MNFAFVVFFKIHKSAKEKIVGWLKLSYMDKKKIVEEQYFNEDNGVLLETHVVGIFIGIISEIWLLVG